MTDRLPAPLAEPDRAPGGGERASASPTRALRREGPSPGAALQPAPGAPRTGLREAERWLVAAILADQVDEASVAGELTPGPQLSAAERLDIYRQSYRARLVECLADDYPAIAAAIGADAFEALALRYLAAHPSRSPNLNAYGRGFAAHCAADAGLGARAPVVADLARLEWALVEVVHAPAAPPLDPARLAALRPEDWAVARLVPAESLRLLHLDHPANRHFQAYLRGAEPELPGPEPSATAVYRKDLIVWRMDLTPAMARVLSALVRGRPIGEALAELGVDETDPAVVAEAERSVSVWFREWVASGFFREVVGPA